MNSKVKEGIQKILDAGKWVVLDESLCVNGMELARTFGIQEKLLYVYSPHKALGLQGIKFSTVVAKQDYYDEIDSLKDCYGGSLNAASQQGTSHFISKNFDECCQIYNGFWHENLVAVKQVLSAYDFAHFSEEMFGHYIMIFFDRSVNCKCFVEAMKQRMCKLGYSIYPGDMQGFDSSKKFCFRVNLLLNREDLVKGLSAILNFFKEERDQKW
ncbi:MAG: hypothetical protein J6Z31_05850 [Fibrobacter sp.]|nr:hypothetical protein [Fibrobacter sp.]